MKKSVVLLFVLSCLMLSACGANPSLSNAKQKDVDVQVAQYYELKEQAETIEQSLKSALASSFDLDIVEINVYHTNSTISASLEAHSGAGKIDRADFGKIISLVGNRFIELSEEYRDYSFRDMTFFYYVTANLGRKISDDPISYRLKADEGVGIILFPGESGSNRYDLAPDEVYYYLSGVSPDSRSIPAPSPIQEVVVPDNLFDPAPKEIFSLLKDEDEYYNHAYYISGVVSERLEVRDGEAIRFSTEYGDLYVVSMMIPLPDVSVDDEVTMFFTYWKWDKVVKGTFVEYVYHE